jgi:omega-6 fatty acid desaturase (delta-12 desaturase)
MISICNTNNYYYCITNKECGHQAFSDSAWINNTVGFILHSLLLVPYYSWKISHSKHHKANAHMDKDQVFVPSKRAPSSKISHDAPSTPVYDLLRIIRQQLFGWPAYLFANGKQVMNKK